MKLFRKLFILYFLASQFGLFAQTDELNSKKYWCYRDRLVHDFMLGIGPNQGESLPLSLRARGTSSQNSSASIGDITISLGTYLGVLATEYELLKENNNNTDRTIKELYFALNALNRLDFIAETYFSSNNYPNGGPASLNGFFVRHDFTSSTLSAIKTKYLNSNPTLINLSGYASTPKIYNEEMSKDQVHFVLMGLRLVNKYIPSNTFYYENGIKKPFTYDSPTTYGIKEEATRIANRIMSFIASNPILSIINPITNDHVDRGWQDKSNAYAYEKIYEDINNNTHLLNSAQLLTALFDNNIVKQNITNFAITQTNNGNLYYPIAAISNRFGTSTTLSLLETKGYYSIATYDWTILLHSRIFNSSSSLLTISGPVFKNILGFSIFNDGLNSKKGNYSYDNNDYGVYDWSVDRRTTNPENRGQDHGSERNGDFNGLDYMLIHNLYCLQYNKASTFGNYNIALRADMLTNMTDYSGHTYYNIAHEMPNIFNSSYLENCNITKSLIVNGTSNSEQNYYTWHNYPINNSIFELNFKAPYHPNEKPAMMKISTSSGKLQLGDILGNYHLNGVININDETVLIIENGAELKLLNNSVLNINKGGQLIIGDGCHLTMEENSVINVNSGGHLSISDNAYVTTATANNIITYFLGSKDCNLYANLSNTIGTYPGDINETGPGQIIFDCADVVCGNNPSLVSGVNIWDNKHYIIDNQLVIHSSSSLYIQNNSNIEFGPNATIIVEPNAKLKVSNSTLREIDKCNGSNKWMGIQILGNPNLDQSLNSNGFANNQGYVVLDNATIRNAKIGVNNLNMQISTATAGWINIPIFKKLGGGILSANESSFKNCETGIKMYPYQNKDATNNPIREISHVSKCTFITDNDYPDNLSSSKVFIDLNGVNKFYINGTTFKNTTTTYDNTMERGTGIKAFNSTFFVKDYIWTTPIKCKFENLLCGIHNVSVLNNSTFVVDDAKFTDNMRGIEIFNTNGFSVTSNTFLISPQVELSVIKPTGVFMNNCKSGYKVEGNSFSTNYPYSQNVIKLSAGIVIDNSGEDDNFIYRNTFNNTRENIIAQNLNRNPATDYEGLQIRCNSFSNSVHGIAITHTDQGIASNQGYFKVVPGSNIQHQLTNNLFINMASNSTSHIHNEGRNIWYKYSNNQPNPPLNNHISPNVNLDASSISYSTANCPSTLSGNGITVLTSDFNLYKTKAKACKDVLELLVDGGNTDDVLWNIETSEPNEAYDLMMGLMQKSPYLSNDVLIETASNENVLTPAMITQVLTANPQSARIPEVWDALNSRSNSFPQYLLNAIANNINISSSKDVLENELAYYLFKKQWNFDEINRIYLSDDDNSATTNLYNFYENDTTFSTEILMVSELLKNGNLNNAYSRMINIPVRINLTEYEEEKYNQLNSFVSLYIDIIQASLSNIEISNEQILDLNVIATDNNNFMFSNAKQLLNMINGIQEFGKVIFPTEQTNRKANGEFIENANEALIKCFPNPAKDYFTIEYNISEEVLDNAQIEIYSSNGTFIKRIKLTTLESQILISTRDFSSGIYVCTLINNGNIIETTNVSVINK